MRTLIVAACALALAGIAAAPAQAASSRESVGVTVVTHHRPHHHCYVKKVRVHHHGHWIVKTTRICR